MKVTHNIYIHVPFCIKKCNYCAFYSLACGNPDWQKYTNSVCEEIRFWGEKLNKTDVPTVFFGGGTPSLMPVPVFEQIMTALHKYFNLSNNCEITLESNP